MRRDLIEQFLVPVCTKVLLRKDDIDAVILPENASEWEEVCDFSSLHGLMPVLFGYLQDIKLSDAQSTAVLISWYGNSFQQEQTTEVMALAVRKLAQIMQKGGLDVMFLKGLSLAQYYPSPMMRIFADIDYYLYGKNDEGLNALEAAGIRSDDVWDYHVHAKMNGVRLELHKMFIDVDRIESNKLVEQTLTQLAVCEGRTCRCEWMGASVANAYRMSPTMNAIFLMRHIGIHFVSEAVSLRMLYDWGLFLLHESKDVDWNKVIALYEQVGMMNYASRIQSLVTDKLGMPVAECCLLKTLDDELTKRIWESILSLGENGNCQGSRLKIGLMRRYEMLRSRWKFKMVYPMDSFWKTYLYLAFRGIKTCSRSKR
jgi:hypothetical protein